MPLLGQTSAFSGGKLHINHIALLPRRSDANRSSVRRLEIDILNYALSALGTDKHAAIGEDIAKFQMPPTHRRALKHIGNTIALMQEHFMDGGRRGHRAVNLHNFHRLATGSECRLAHKAETGEVRIVTGAMSGIGEHPLPDVEREFRRIGVPHVKLQHRRPRNCPTRPKPKSFALPGIERGSCRTTKRLLIDIDNIERNKSSQMRMVAVGFRERKTIPQLDFAAWLAAGERGERQAVYDIKPHGIWLFVEQLRRRDKIAGKTMRRCQLEACIASPAFRHFLAAEFWRSRCRHRKCAVVLFHHCAIDLHRALHERIGIALEESDITTHGHVTEHVILSDDDAPEELKNKIKNDPTTEETKVRLIHNGLQGGVPFEFKEESGGTQRYYELIGILMLLVKESHFVAIDELECRLHPDLYEHFVTTYLNNANDSQMIFTTHMREFLDDKGLFRDDSIWLTEKKENGSSEIFSLADFGSDVLRDSTNRYNMYRAGRLGAVPRLQDTYIENTKKCE